MKLNERIKAVQKSYAEDRLDEAKDEINRLRADFPENLTVGYIWCLIAFRCRSFSKLTETAEWVLSQATDDPIRFKMTRVLSASYYYLRQKDLTLVNQAKSVFLLHSMSLKNRIYSPTERPQTFSAENALDTLIEILSDLCSQEIVCAPYFGTLLGLHRSGKLIKHDKDIDLMCRISDMSKIENTILSRGFIPDRSIVQYSTFSSYVNVDQKLTIDLSGFVTDEQGSATGFFSDINDSSWSFIQRIPKLEFDKSNKFGTPIYLPTNVEEHLKAVYGEEWRTPDSNYLPFLNDQSAIVTPLYKFFCIEQILGAWESGDLERSRKAALFASIKMADDHLIMLLIESLIRYREPLNYAQ